MAKGGGDVVKRVIFAQKYGSSHWPEVKILKVMPILICSPKNMGKKLQNELCAVCTSGSFKIVVDIHQIRIISLF